MVDLCTYPRLKGAVVAAHPCPFADQAGEEKHRPPVVTLRSGEGKT